MLLNMHAPSDNHKELQKLKALNDAYAKQIIAMGNELAVLKASLPKVLADAVLDYEESLSSFNWTAEEYIKVNMEAGSDTNYILNEKLFIGNDRRFKGINITKKLEAGNEKP